MADLPPQLRRRLLERAKERKITLEDIFALEEWRLHSPDVPEGPWFKDFGSLSLVEKVSIRRLFF